MSAIACDYDFARLPAAMKALKRYVLWRVGPMKPNGKFGKIPISPTTLKVSSPHDPANWLGFDAAVDAFEGGDCDGIGLALDGKPDSQGRYLTCIDLDGANDTEASALHTRLGDPWAEISPSGKGFHFWMWSKCPLKGGNAGNGRELYQSNQFVTVTGTSAGSDGGELIDATVALTALHDEWFGAKVRSHASEPQAGALAGAVRMFDPLTAQLAGNNRPPPPETPAEVQRVKDMLSAVGADCNRETWRACVWAVLSTGWMCAERLVTEWSEGGGTKYVERDLQGLIDSHSPARSPQLGTLVMHAKQAGWIEPASALHEGGPQAGYKDVRNGREFANQWRGKLLYVTSRERWLIWEDNRWHLCQKGEDMRAAKAVAERLVTEAQALLHSDPTQGARLMRHATEAHKKPRLDAMISLAKSEPGMAVTEAELDADPHMLGVANGTVDLRTGALIPNGPEQYITRYCNAVYEPENSAGSPRWLKFLDEVFSGDTDTIEAVQRLLGYTLTGLSTEEVLVIAYGFGANGKSVFGNVVHSIMGGYSSVAGSSLLVARGPNDTGPRPDLAGLVGARHVSINELQSGDRLDERIVKVLAGREPITARHLYGHQFTFQPTFTPWLRTNHKPIVHNTDDGIWRRLVLLPFKRQFKDEDKDPQLEQKLHAERNGILAWMIAGAVKYLREGLKPSAAMRGEIQTYRSESDVLGQFLADATGADPNEWVEQQTLFSVWRQWCESNGSSYGTKHSFTRRLKELGFSEKKSNGVRLYGGLRLRGGIFGAGLPSQG